MEKVKLSQIIKCNNGLNVVANANVGIKDLELALDISIFKAESEKLVKAFQEVAATIKGKEKEKEKELAALLEKEYEIAMPELTLSALKESKEEIPLIAFDYLHEFIKK